jgi:predicted enzyme related to lactoylglutathione lyase
MLVEQVPDLVSAPIPMKTEPGQPLQLRLCIDVDDLNRGLRFYVEAFGLRPGRRYAAEWGELLGSVAPIDLIANAPGTAPLPGAPASRSYDRHWTPVHVDIVVQGIEAAVERAVRAGAKLERPIQTRAWGRLANLADPFGHGLCLLEFRGRGYDEMLGAP